MRIRIVAGVLFILTLTSGQTSAADVSGSTVVATGSSQARTLAARFGESANILDYGADPSGLTDSTSAIASAITAAGTAKPISAPAGTYLVHSTNGSNCLYLTSGQKLVGAGAGLTTFKITTAIGQDGNSVIGIAPNASNVELSDFTIDGSLGTSVSTAIYVYAGSSDLKIHDISLINVNCSTANIFCIGGTNGLFDRITIDDPDPLTNGQHKRQGIRIDNSSATANIHRITNCTVYDCAFAFSAVYAQYLTFDNDRAFASNINNCLEGFNLDSCSFCQLSNIVAIGRGDNGYTETFNEHVPLSPMGQYNHINGAYFMYNKLAGMYIKSGYGLYQNIYAVANGQPGSTPNDGICIASPSVNGTVTGAHGFNNANYGLSVASGALQMEVMDSRFGGNNVGDLTDAGGYTVYSYINSARVLITNAHRFELVPSASDNTMVDFGSGTNITRSPLDGHFEINSQSGTGQINTLAMFFAGRVYPGTPAGATQSYTGITGGLGAPSNGNGYNGDLYIRSDGGSMTTVYQKRAGIWVGIL